MADKLKSLIVCVLLAYNFALVQSVCPPNCLANTNCDVEPDGGCPQCTKAYYGRQCQYRMECRYTTLGREYRGLLNTTKGGYTCQVWSSQSPHYHGNLGINIEGNYCRNPDYSSPGPWCYTTNPSKRYDYCAVPKCGTQCTAPPQPPGSIVLNPAKPEEGFNNGYTVQIRCPGQSIIESVCNPTFWTDVSCPVIKCENPMLNNSHITHPQLEYIYGMTINVMCNIGYGNEEEGFTFKCTENKTWNGSWPNCKAITCEDPLLQNHSYIEKQTGPFEYKTEINISCDIGYELTGEKTFQCLANKTWSGSWPNCTIIKCENQVLNNNTYVVGFKPDYEYGTDIKISCYAGFELDNNTTFKCLANKSWDGYWQNCTAIKCESPLLQDNSYIINNASYYEYGTEINVACDIGYEIEGNTKFQCLANKSWSGSWPNCTIIKCENQVLENNTFVIGYKSEYEYGTKIDISCQTGYELKTDATYKCLANKSWDGYWPNCTAILCENPALINSRFIVTPGSKYEYGTDINISCSNGYELHGISSLECLANKTWSRPLPKCTVIVAKVGSLILPGYGIGLGVTAVLVVVMLTLGVLVFLRIHKRKKPKSVMSEAPSMKENDFAKKETDIQSKEDEDEIVYANDTCEVYSNMASDLLNVDELPNYIQNKTHINEQFKNLEQNPLYSQFIAQDPQNVPKNKYKRMYPYDNNRVILDTSGGESGYINASPIKDQTGKTKFIAAQGPIPTTKTDFWRMVWQFNIYKIVMLTNLKEKGKVKCVQYWPDDNQLKFGNIKVCSKCIKVYANYVIRELKVSKNNEFRTIYLFHFTAWPDKSVPSDPLSLVLFRLNVVNHDDVPNVPTLVHCSAGVGRTGTYIALDILSEEAKLDSRISPLQCIKHLRQQRFYMIQTSEQYVFLHNCVWETHKVEHSLIPISEFVECYTEMKALSIITAEFKNLPNFNSDKSLCLSGRQKENANKNRFSNILPVDKFRPYLQGIESGSDYINAVFAQGLHHKHEYILTQSPLPDTMQDFWKLIYQENVNVIVRLEGGNEESCGIYYESSEITFGQISVKHISDVAINSDLLITELEISIGKHCRRVTEITAIKWDLHDVCPPSADYMLNLVENVDIKHGNDVEVPILIHCLDGATKSGLFCLVHSVITRIKEEKIVIVPTIVEQLRKRRSQVIPCQSQYEFCYECVNAYLDHDEIYANV